MEINALEHRPRRSSRWRRFAGLATGIAVAASVLVVSQPAVAADPWVTQLDDGYVRFAVPNADVEAAVGPVSNLVIEGNFGASANWAQYGLSRSGATWAGTLGPLEPGLYYYQVTGDDSKTFKDPTNATSVAS